MFSFLALSSLLWIKNGIYREGNNKSRRFKHSPGNIFCWDKTQPSKRTVLQSGLVSRLETLYLRNSHIRLQFILNIYLRFVN